MVAAMLLFLQGTASAASALACMKACSEAQSASTPSCHGEQKAKPACQPEQGCDGACAYVCSPDKDKAVPVADTTVQHQTVVVAAVLPTVVEHVFIEPVEEPELLETDSSPPFGRFYASHSLRAPPSSCA